ncbi:hypothetical protein [Nocardia lasii]|uniref:Uncharacterized protein n=1 Tax=Nocardia lasii TaxID=1616107 RepID=A0ABW1JS69_9NOCA
MRRPRAMVLDEVWRGVGGVDALSGAQGGPLRRTVKLILDPLVLRPVRHPGLAGSVLDADGVALLTALVHAQADVLRACSAWFVVVKQARRALRITEGNAQDLYFQRCFELAVTCGAPGMDGRARAEAMLREVHESTGGRTTAALKRYVTEPNRVVELNGLLDIAWSRRPLAPFGARDLSVELTELLDACTLAREGDPADAGPLFDDLLDDGAGTHRGVALWLAHPRAGADDLGLTAFEMPRRPELGSSASTANLALPFDRTVYERVFTVLQGSLDRVDLPEIPELVTREISRSCSPWGLLDESLRVAAASGAELALGLSPLGATGDEEGSVAIGTGWGGLGGSRGGELVDRGGSTGRELGDRHRTEGRGLGDRDRSAGLELGDQGASAYSPGHAAGSSRAHEVVNSRWRREGYVLQARRYAVHGVEGQAGPLAAVAVELRTPWRPYLRRLWVRLHGRDVRELPVYEPGELWDLLDGVARSVMLDHRTRVKQALSVFSEARAS